MRSIQSCAIAAALVLVGCEKDGGLSSKASGKLSGGEAALLADLPAGNVVLFGGNYLKLQQYFQQSPLGRILGSLEAASPGIKEWSACFVEKGSVQMLGAVAFTGDQVAMSYVMKGMSVADIEACAKRAKFPAAIDADGKFISIEMPGPLGPTKSGYLVLPDGALFTRQPMPIPPAAAPPPQVDRAAIEASVPSPGGRNATADAALVAALERVDRSRAIWFVGTGEGTPIADKVGVVRGWMDLGAGLAMDVTVQIKDASLADEIAKGVPELKKQAKQLGGDIGGIVDGLRFDRAGDQLHFAIKISDRQLEAITKQLQPFLPKAQGDKPDFQF